MVATKIVPVGNGLGIRLPRSFLEAIGANRKDTPVSIVLANDAIIIRKQVRKRKTYEALMEDFYQKPFAEIDVYLHEAEIDWGNPSGEEIW